MTIEVLRLNNSGTRVYMHRFIDRLTNRLSIRFLFCQGLFEKIKKRKMKE